MLSGIKQLFPSFSDNFIQDILNKNATNPFLIKGHNYENIEHKLKEFKSIENAIKSLSIIELVYREKKRVVQPYRLANVKGIWYLIGKPQVNPTKKTKVKKLQTPHKITSLTPKFSYNNSIKREVISIEELIKTIENQEKNTC